MKININDTIKIKGIQKVFIVTKVSTSVVFCIDQYYLENKEVHTFFINEIDKVLTVQKQLPLEYEVTNKQTQLTLF